MALKARADLGPRVRRPSAAALSAARTVLILVPNAHRAGEIAFALQRSRLPAVVAETAIDALFWAKQEPPALTIVDLRVERARMLIDHLLADGRSVVVVSDDAVARKTALEIGCLEAEACSIPADELAAKVKALVRVGKPRRVGRIIAGPLEVDLSAGRILWAGVEVESTPLLVRLAASLASHAGELVPIAVLLEEVWGDHLPDPFKVHRAIWRLRRLLGIDRTSPFLVGRRGIGYGIFQQIPAVRSTSRRSSLP